MLANKNIIVTGASRGIGKATVETSASLGANVWAVARTQTEVFEKWCETVSKQNGVEIWPVYVDFSEESQMKTAFEQIKARQISVDGLVNAAGCVFNANFNMTSGKAAKELFDINYFALVQWTQYVLKKMARQKSGSIVNIASSGGIDGNTGRTAYNASKAAVISTTQTLAHEVGVNGIRVNAVAPGLTDTDMARDYTPEDVMQRELEGTSLKRIGKPEEIANVICMLLSDFTSYVTGQVWRVDGGMF